MAELMRVVVVGAGVVGLLTAVECVRAGAQVELVEQAPAIPSTAAASYDRHRVVRALHRGNPALTRAAAGLHQGWLEIEQLLGRRFYHRTGVLTVGAPANLAADRVALAESGAPIETLLVDELAERYPQVRFDCDDQAILEPDAGTVLADQALLAASWWLRGRPAVQIHQHTRVVKVTESRAVLLADGDVLGGDAVVVAAGPWSRSLLPRALGAALTLKRQTMLSYQPASLRPQWLRAPAILGLGGSGRDAWLMPPVAGTPVRLSAASACRTVAELTDRDTPEQWREHLIDRFSGQLTDFQPAAVTGATEGYYLTDEAGQGPMLVQLGDEAVWAYAACGGMSFKFAPVLARTLAALALGRTPAPTGLAPVDQPRRFAAVRRELFI
ncbi:MAG: FAD-dependent oxidoreductase [Jatrophihabitantaceae bacterium]